MEEKKVFKPLVSIIIPVYNGGDFLKCSIESALNQTYKNIEIIVVNDGSNDNGKTENIAKKYGNKIKYFFKENGGVASALNFGIKHMTGEYFSWLSHDDLYEKNKIETQISILESYSEKERKNTILYSNYNLIDENGNIISKVIFDHKKLLENMELSVLNGCVNGITLLINKNCFENVGYFNESLWCTQDYDEWFRMMLKGITFMHVDKVLANYRIHSNQTSKLSDKALKEGNKLWINMVNNLPKKTKEKLYGSEYNFYNEMTKFIENTPYDVAKRQIKFKKQELFVRKEEIANLRVSVIIPFYNNDISELLRAYNSVINQTHKNYEIIFINDGSSKNYEKFLKIIKNDNNCIYLENKINMGVSYSRNLGIDKSSGKYIAFLDADDEFVEDKIENQLNLMVKCKSKFSHSSYYRNLNDKITLQESGKLNGDVLSELIYGCIIATPTIMIEKKFLIDNKIKYKDEIGIAEDICFYLEIAKKTYILGINEPLSIVHASENSSAYDKEKQIIGLQNLLRYILNDDVLKEYHHEISKLIKIILEIENLNLEKESYDIDEINRLKKENNDLRYQLNVIKNSRSWKITKPLRGKFVKKIRG